MKVNNEYKLWFSENRRDLGKWFRLTALFLGAVAFLLLIEYKIQASETLSFKANLAPLPTIDSSLVDSTEKLANSLNMASQALGYTSLAVGLISLGLLYGTGKKEESTKEKLGKGLKSLGTILTAIALTGTILWWIHMQEVSALKEMAQKLPIPGSETMAENPEKLAHFFQIVGWSAGGASLICNIAGNSLHKEKDKVKKITKTFHAAFCIFLYLTALLALQSIIHAKEAANLQTAFATFPIPVPGIGDLTTSLYDLSTTLRNAAIITGALSLNSLLASVALRQMKTPSHL